MLSKFSVKKPLTIFVAVLMIIVLGAVSLTGMTPDLLPSLDLPYAVVITTYPGATPEEVEEAITKPLEQSMASLENINSISSTSSDSVSQIMLEFAESANMDAVVPDIREQINLVSGAWDDMVGTPFILKLNPNLLPVTVSAMNVDGMSNTELTTLLETELLSKLEGITGVASVDVTGNVQEEVSIVISDSKVQLLNAKISESLYEQFDEAERELNDATSELEGQIDELDSAKNQIQDGQSALLDQTQGVEQELTAQKQELEAALLEMESALASAQAGVVTLQTTLTTLETAKTQYNNAQNEIKEIDSTISRLNEIKTSHQNLTLQISAIETELLDPTITEERKAELELELTGLQAQLNTLNIELTTYGISAAEIDAKIDELDQDKQNAQLAMTAIETTLTAMQMDINTVDVSIAQIQTQINEATVGIAQLETTITQMEAGAVGLEDGLMQLENERLKGALQLSNSLSEVVAGQTALQSALAQTEGAKDEFDTQKETALEAAELSITIDMINGLITAQNFSMPVGYIEEDGEDYLVRVGEEKDGVEELSNLVLFDTGIEDIGVIRLSDVADVALTDNAQDVYAKVNGENAMVLSFSKQSTYATATVSENIANRFKELESEYEGLHFSNLMDQGDYINVVIGTVFDNLIYGGILAVLILILFLKDLKPTIVIAASIPISILFALVLMYFSGVTLNIISLSGLAIGVGMLVDNSVVVIENIYRMRALGVPPLKAAVQGATQVSGAIFASTLTTVCVFLPIVFIEGITRQIFTDMALTIGYSLMASLIVALTLVPAMSSGLLKNSKTKEHKIFDKINNGYEKIARVSLKHKWVAILLSVALLGGSAFVALSQGFIFMPSMSGTQITVEIEMPEDASFEEIADATDAVLAQMQTIPEIITAGATISSSSSGAGIMSMMSGASGSSSIYAVIDEGAGIKDFEISEQIVAKCADIGYTVSAQGTTDMSSMMSLGGSGVSAKIYGNNTDELIEDAYNVEEVLKSIEGIDEVDNGIQDATDERRIVVDEEKAAEYGLTVAQIFQIVASELVTQSTASSQLNVEGYNKDIIINLEEDEDIDLGAIEIDYSTNAGESGVIKLSEISQIINTQSLNSISRDNQRRQLSISASIKDGYNITLVTAEVEKALENFEPLAGNSIEIGGENESIMEAVEQLSLMLALAVLIIYCIMVAQFQSFRLPLIVMFTIPLAFTGGFIALLVTGTDVSVVALLGLVMLSGIIVNNGIVLIDYINVLRLDGMEKKEAIIIAGKTRLRPILMTALTTILGLIFMAVATGFGSEMTQPIAIVCIGGLLYGTLMTLFVVPAMYDFMGKKNLVKREVD